MSKAHLDRLFMLATFNPKRLLRVVKPSKHSKARALRAKARIARRKAKR